MAAPGSVPLALAALHARAHGIRRPHASMSVSEVCSGCAVQETSQVAARAPVLASNGAGAAPESQTPRAPLDDSLRFERPGCVGITPPSGVAANFPLGGVMWCTVLQ